MFLTKKSAVLYSNSCSMLLFFCYHLLHLIVQKPTHKSLLRNSLTRTIYLLLHH
nr:MAG TPA: hypothetical protein [Caudoviricetes sp.]